MAHSRLLFVLAAGLALASVCTPARAQDSLRVTLFFKVGETAVEPGYMGNGDRLLDFERALGDRPVTSVVIGATASPEGNAAANRVLADKRAKAMETVLRGLLPRYTGSISRTAGFEYDWSSMRTLNVTAEMLRELRTGTITVVRERQQPEQAEPVTEKTEVTPLLSRPKTDTAHHTPHTTLHDKRHAPCPPRARKARKPLTIALKTNMLFDAVGAANLGIEIPIRKHLSLTFDGAYSFWRINNLYALQTIQGGAAAKWWFNQRRGRLTGWNAGVYGMFCTRYDVQWLDGLQGDGFWSVGVQGGYALPIGKRLRLEAAAAAGFVHTPEVRFYDRPENGHLMWRQTRNKVGRVSLTKLQLNLVWLLGKGAKL